MFTGMIHNRSVLVTVLVGFSSCVITGVGEPSCGDEFLPESSVCIGESFPESARPWSGDSTAIGWPTNKNVPQER